MVWLTNIAAGVRTGLKSRRSERSDVEMLAKPARKAADPRLSLPTDYRFHVSRHDHHNLELKSSLDLDGQYTVGRFELYLFLPHSVHLRSYSKTKLSADFHSRARLSFPRDLDDEQAILIQEIEKLTALIKTPPGASQHAGLEDEIFSTAKHLGAVLGEMLKARSVEHRKEIFLTHSLSNTATDPSPQLNALALAIEQLDGIVEHVRGLINCGSGTNLPVLELLDQYIHLTYIDYLGAVRGELERVMALKTRFESKKFKNGWKELSRVLDQAQAKEMEWLGGNSAYQKLAGCDLERERHLLKLSQLKKFFQSETFVDVTQHEGIKKVSEPIAAGAAGLAALGTAAVEKLHNPGWISAGFRGLFVLSFGIIIYALKDRLKDRFRQFFTKKISRIVPDYQQQMVVDGKRLGEVREWFAVKKRAAVPSSVKQLRTANCLTEAEKHIPEDVLHYRREFTFKRVFLRTAGSRVSLNEILRLNLQRYLKHMDDPFREIRMLDSGGNFSLLRSHRVYHFYVCVAASASQTPHKSRRKPRLDQPHDYQEIFRVVMDKGGIDRVERAD